MALLWWAGWVVASSMPGHNPGATTWPGSPAWAQEEETHVLRGDDAVAVRFQKHENSWRWVTYADLTAGREWQISGPLFSLQTADGRRTNLGDTGFARLLPSTKEGKPCVVLEAELASPPVAVRQTFTFCEDGRTVRIRSALRALDQETVIQRVGLFEAKVEGQSLKLMGPGHVSSPVFGDRIFAGIEHPGALCQVDGDTFYLAQHSYTRVGAQWTALPGAVLGSASDDDETRFNAEAMRRAFLRYLDTVRVKPADMHVHYNNWWTMPVPFTEADVLANVAQLRHGLYDETGFFFDSYAMDMGWSDPHTVWEVDKANYPQGFDTIRQALAAMQARPGLWVSPSSLYPPALDNQWLEDNGYETSPGSHIGRFACLALGGKYQRAFKDAVLQHARDASLGHVKFDGLAWPCDVATHGHKTGIESYQPIADGLMDVFDALRAQDAEIALEPTCLGYYPSPWWLMHTPFVIGPFGDDSPRGRCPCPEWIESMTTGRDIANLRGREAFLMPSAALECFDIIVQCPGDFENHGVMAIARGHWFLSCYMNPKYMDGGEWRFFADLVRWARANRDMLQEPLPMGGDPAERKPYGYAYTKGDRQLCFVRNPWIEQGAMQLPEGTDAPAREVRMLYPRREVLCRVAAGRPLPSVPLGPYELALIEVVPTQRPPREMLERRPSEVIMASSGPAKIERVVYEQEPAAFGPDWTCPDGDATVEVVFSGAAETNIDTPAQLCLLVAGTGQVNFARGSVQIDGVAVDVTGTRSAGSFSATGAAPVETWVWLLADLPAGRHQVSFRVCLPEAELNCGAFVRGLTSREPAESFPAGEPPMPVYRPTQTPWSRTVVPLTSVAEDTPSRTAKRRIVKIDGVYLDTLQWQQASAGWGSVHRNRSVMGKPMQMAGRTFHRGIGTHAQSRIVYRLPPGLRHFVATIGCDQEVSANSIVFIVEGDGRELFRSPLMHYDSPLIEVDVPVNGVDSLALILEDGGDGIIADHGNWADARLLR